MFRNLTIVGALILVLVGLLSSLSNANPISDSYGYNMDLPSNNIENYYDSQDDSVTRQQRFAWAVSKISDYHKVILIIFLKL